MLKDIPKRFYVEKKGVAGDNGLKKRGSGFFLFASLDLTLVKH